MHPASGMPCAPAPYPTWPYAPVARRLLSDTRSACTVVDMTITRTLATALAALAVFASPASAFASPLIGDDNHTGVVMEDESGWDCATMGNLVCGPLAR